MAKVSRIHLDEQIELLRDHKDPGFDMSNWCGTTHCLYGGAALLAGQSPETIVEGLPDDWDIGPDTTPLRKLFLSAYLSADLVVKLYDAIKDGKLNLSGADLSGANLKLATLGEADLREADLSRADLSGADLTGADLTRADLSGANLRGVNLRGANLYGTDLYGATLIGANLIGADLTRADLRKANLSGAYLREAVLSEANLTGAIGLPE